MRSLSCCVYVATPGPTQRNWVAEHSCIKDVTYVSKPLWATNHWRQGGICLTCCPCLGLNVVVVVSPVMDMMGNAVRSGSSTFYPCNDVVGVTGVIFRSTQATREPKSISGVITGVQVPASLTAAGVTLSQFWFVPVFIWSRTEDLEKCVYINIYTNTHVFLPDCLLCVLICNHK